MFVAVEDAQVPGARGKDSDLSARQRQRCQSKARARDYSSTRWLQHRQPTSAVLPGAQQAASYGQTILTGKCGKVLVFALQLMAISVKKIVFEKLLILMSKSIFLSKICSTNDTAMLIYSVMQLKTAPHTDMHSIYI